MSRPDFRALAKRGVIHFMGVGGAGMFPLAELVARSGATVSGCDMKASDALEGLKHRGCAISVGHGADHARDAAALVVTAAIPSDHVEIAAARAAGIPVFKRAEALGSWVSAGRVLGIAGTHGKTTTTAMATEILAAAGQDPTGVVGGRVSGWDGNLRHGGDDLFVVEADEYDRSFLTLAPDVAVVTNLEADHLEIYGDLEGVRRSFRDFLAGVRGGGRVVVCADDHGASSLLRGVGQAGVSYGTSAGSMVRATDVASGPNGSTATLWEEGREVGKLRLPMGGRHNLLNALGAAAAARALSAPWEPILNALAAFRGVGRRFEVVGEAGGVTVVDDYAHHPTEICAALQAARASFPGRRIVAAFQPHLFSRTRDFARQFGEALASADVVWVTDVFPAREAPIAGVTGETIVEAVREAGASRVHYEADLDLLPAAILRSAEGGDVVVTLGAGSIEKSGAELVALLGEPVHA